MRVLLDEETCPGPASSVSEAITTAAAAAQERGRIVIEVIVDGTIIDATNLGADELPATAGEVRLRSASLTDLVCDALDDATTALSDAEALQRTAAERVQRDQTTAAMNELSEALAIWQDVQAAVVQTAEAIDVDLGSLRVGEEPVADVVGRLEQALQGLRRALEDEDPVGLADTLLYDLPDVITSWRGLLDALRTCATTSEADTQRRND